MVGSIFGYPGVIRYITLHSSPGLLRMGIPLNTQPHNNVVTTSLQRRDVAATMYRRCADVVCLLGKELRYPNI